MRGAWKIGSVAGIAVQVHWTFLILLAWVALAYGAEGGPAAALRGALLICLLFATVVAHELGHAMAARWFGVRTLDITLLPIGGVARLERFPEEALPGLVIALAGPLVSGLIAAVLLGGALVVGGPLALLPGPGASLVVQLGLANLLLCLFNLLPAFPMDGGRALRAALAAFVGSLAATRYAAAVGRVMAALFGVVGLMSNPFLLLIALFVWLQGAAEEQAALVRHALRRRTVVDALARDVRVLPPGTTVADAAMLLQHGLQQEFPVVGDGRLVGVVGQGDLVRALAAGFGRAPVTEVMRRDVAPLPLATPLTAAYERLQEAAAAGLRALPVVDEGGELVGLVGLDTVAGLMAVAAAAAAARPRPGRDRFEMPALGAAGRAA
ncbi:MAG: CBS domain-containing protein [Planctomycetes bacterium]|nr:CBS domain-containing protein [Planctomycetota bacterium]